MSDENDTTKPTPPKQGRSLRDRETRPVAAEAEPDPARPYAGDGVAPEPETEARSELDPMEQRMRAAVGPKVLVWNTTAGNRFGIANIVARDENGKPRLDGAGMTIYAEKISEIIKPGLNLVARETYDKVREGLQHRIDLAELQILGDDPRDVDSGRLIRAIKQTGLDAPLRWIAERDTRGNVQTAIEAQFRTFRQDEQRQTA